MTVETPETPVVEEEATGLGEEALRVFYWRVRRFLYLRLHAAASPPTCGRHG